jgi:hypothetical protein
LNTQQRGFGVCYLMDEEHLDKKVAENVRLAPRKGAPGRSLDPLVRPEL